MLERLSNPNNEPFVWSNDSNDCPAEQISITNFSPEQRANQIIT